jgi:Zn-dependent M16 (insulinase) family peptidase
MDPLLSPSAKIRVSDGRIFTNLTPEKIAELREQLLKTSMEDLSEAGDILNRMYEDAVYCIVGPQELIDSCEDEDLTVYSI